MRLSRIRNFIIKERIYVWLLIFIISVSIALGLTKEKKPELSVEENVGPKEKISSGTGKFSNKILTESLTKEDLRKIIEGNKNLAVILTFLSFGIVLAIAIGLFVDFIILILIREGGVLLFPTLFHKEPRWNTWDVCKIAILFVWFSYVLMFIESDLAGIFPILKTDENLRSVVNATIMDTLVFVLMIYFVVYEYKEKITSLGLSFKNFLRNVGYGITGYLAVIPSLILLLLFIIWASTIFRYKPPMQPVMEIFFEEKKRGLIMYFTIFVAIFGPIVEEMFFRGFMYQAVKKRWGFKTALFSTSIVFSFLHTNLAGFLPIMVLGMLLAYLFEKTGTLIASCAVHILHNSAMVCFVFLIKGLLR
ncbi:MAG: CPBP family intramembrane metalloprotease [Candidatus Omnitrophica bacterium]|nr:CPBP family intramembrane metalloprotease [Candidatus Omnitrophota bacterium]